MERKLPNVNFEKIWKNTFISYGQSSVKDLHCSLLHYSTKTNDYMHKCLKDNNPNCDYCRLTEDNLHLFIKCTRIQKIWTHYQAILTKLTGKTYKPQQHLLSLNVSNTYKYTRKLTLTITDSYICFRLALLHSVSYFFFLY